VIADIKFDCTHCGQRLVVDPEGAGTAAVCPNCETALVVPQTSNLGPAANGDSTAIHRAVVANGNAHAGEAHTRRDELAEATMATSRLERALAQARGEAAESRRLIQELQAERTSLASANHTMQAQLSRLQAECPALHENLELARHRTSALEAQLVDREQEQAELAQLQAECPALHESLELARHRTSALEAQLESRERDLAQAHAEISLAAAETDSTRRELEQFTAEAARLTTEMAITQATLSVRDEELSALRTEAAETLEELEATGKELDEFIEYSNGLEKENDTLRNDLASSEKGRELLEVRERIKVAETECAQAVRLREQAEVEMKRAVESERRQKADVESLLNRLKDAERRAELVSESHLQHENEVQRGIIERQKGEMERQFGELLRLRSARFGTRIAYLLFGASVVALFVLVMRLVPKLLSASGL